MGPFPKVMPDQYFKLLLKLVWNVLTAEFSIGILKAKISLSQTTKVWNISQLFSTLVPYFKKLWNCVISDWVLSSRPDKKISECSVLEQVRDSQLFLLHKTFLGTKLCAPPEWHKDPCSYKPGPTTVWSLGILLYEMLSRRIPFANTSKIVEGKFEMLQNISKGGILYNVTIIEKVSTFLECEDLISKCLTHNAKDRILLRSICNHSWFGRKRNSGSEHSDNAKKCRMIL